MSRPAVNITTNAMAEDAPVTAHHPIPELSKNELDRVTEVFKMFETGQRDATIYPKVLLRTIYKAFCV